VRQILALPLRRPALFDLLDSKRPGGTLLGNLHALQVLKFSIACTIRIPSKESSSEDGAILHIVMKA
jgi:hypothetical protein